MTEATHPPARAPRRHLLLRALRRRAPGRHRVRHRRRRPPLGGRGRDRRRTSCSPAARRASTRWPPTRPPASARRRSARAPAGSASTPSTSATTATAPSSTAWRCGATSPRAIRRTRPELVVAQTWGERFGGGMVNQADHRAVGLATLDAVADAGNRWLHTDLADEGLEPWGGVKALAVAGSATPTHFVDVSGEHFEASVHSLEAHDGLQRRPARGVPAAARAARHDPRRRRTGRRGRARRALRRHPPRLRRFVRLTHVFARPGRRGLACKSHEVGYLGQALVRFTHAF